MTVLDNAVDVDATPEDVWAVLAELDTLHEFDPGVRASQVISQERRGSGAVRRCELTPKGWFEERVTEWRPAEALAFELSECSLPVKSLRYRYTLEPHGGGTRVTQRMEYRLKFGPLGSLLDAVVVRRKWDKGIKGFFSGLKLLVESGRSIQH